MIVIHKLLLATHTLSADCCGLGEHTAGGMQGEALDAGYSRVEGDRQLKQGDQVQRWVQRLMQWPDRDNISTRFSTRGMLLSTNYVKSSTVLVHGNITVVLTIVPVILDWWMWMICKHVKKHTKCFQMLLL